MKLHAEEIREQLRGLSDPKLSAGARRFFKEEINSYGVKSAEVKKIARQAVKTLRQEQKAVVFSLCEDLWQSGYLEEGGIAAELAYSLHNRYVPEDFRHFERWLELYVSNWAACDTLCNHSVAEFVMRFPEYIRELKLWTASPNRWKQRAAAVTLIIPARRGLFLRDIFEIADRLLLTPDDLVQKGYGWMLKAAGEAHPEAVFDFLLARRETMPRTAFRYALEKLPPEMRRQAMLKTSAKTRQKN